MTSKATQFVAGNKASPGRRGAKNKLHHDFVVALQQHFEVVGATAIEIAYRKSPLSYLKLIASIMPRELELTVGDGRLETMSDEELETHLERIRELRSGPGRGILIEGTIPTSDRKQAPVLQTLPKAERVPRRGPKSP